MQYQVKRELREAAQFLGLDSYLAIFKWMKDCGDTHALANEVTFQTPLMFIHEPQGISPAFIGDYIVRDKENRFYVCRKDIFESIYEEVKP